MFRTIRDKCRVIGVHFLSAIYTAKVLGQEWYCTRASFSIGYTVGTKKKRKRLQVNSVNISRANSLGKGHYIYIVE